MCHIPHSPLPVFYNHHTDKKLLREPVSKNQERKNRREIHEDMANVLIISPPPLQFLYNCQTVPFR